MRERGVRDTLIVEFDGALVRFRRGRIAGQRIALFTARSSSSCHTGRCVIRVCCAMKVQRSRPTHIAIAIQRRQFNCGILDETFGSLEISKFGLQNGGVQCRI